MNNSKNTVTLFTTEQHAAILMVLESKCQEGMCVPRPDIYATVQNDLGDMTEVSFNNRLSNSIKEGLFVGFSTRRGRTGGIHRVGTFDAHDVTRKSKVTKTKKSKTQTVVEVAGTKVTAQAKAKVLQRYIVDVLGGTEDVDGSVKVEDKTYMCDVDGFNKYLTAMVETV